MFEAIKKNTVFEIGGHRVMVGEQHYTHKESDHPWYNCKIDDEHKNAKVGDTFQFMRQGYFCIDKDSSEDNLIINRTVALKDSFTKK